MATKTKQPKAIQAKKPTEEKFLTSKDLAKMAKVEPRLLRRCLRKDFSGRITATKGDNGLKTYRIPANDPVIKEILAKLKGNGDKGKATEPAKAQVDKGAGGEPAPEQVSAYDEIVKGKKAPSTPESLDRIEAFDAIYGGQESREKMEKLVAQTHSGFAAQFIYQGYKFTLHRDLTVTVINPDNSISQHNCLANALHQRGFGFKQLEKEGALPKELTKEAK